MISIKKMTAPLSLVNFSNEPLDIDNPFSDAAVKRDIQDSLIKEQKGLCAYCMSRIKIDNIVIEHIMPKSLYINFARKYSNLLGTCNNSNGHCDKSKSDNELKYVHRSIFIDIDNYIHYDNDGKILSSNSDLGKDINENKLLNLNSITYLCRNRKSVIVEVEKQIEVLINSCASKVQIKK